MSVPSATMARSTHDPYPRTARRPDMAGETIITVVGNLVDDPELRFTPSGAAVANFRIASTPRTFDRQTNEWKDGDALFLSCSVWRQAAENVAESLVSAACASSSRAASSPRQYETREGEKRTVFEIEVEEVGPSLQVRHRQGHPHHPPGRWRRLLRRRRSGRRPGGPVGPAGPGRRRPAGRRQLRRPAGPAPGRRPAAGWPRQRPVGRSRRRLRRAPVLTHHPSIRSPTIPA